MVKRILESIAGQNTHWKHQNCGKLEIYVNATVEKRCGRSNSESPSGQTPILGLRHLNIIPRISQFAHFRTAIADYSSIMPRAIISPSVLASDFGQLTAECKRMIAGGAEWLHMGKFMTSCCSIFLTLLCRRYGWVNTFP